MKITGIQPIEAMQVETDEKELNIYTRYSSQCWYVEKDKSDEWVHDCEDLENLYQKYMN